MRVYKIAIEDIKFAIGDSETKERQNDKTIVLKKVKNKFENMPLKVVYKVEDDKLILITTYALKKRTR